MTDRFKKLQYVFLYALMPAIMLSAAVLIGHFAMVFLVVGCVLLMILFENTRNLRPDLGLPAVPTVGLLALALLIGDVIYGKLQDRMQRNLVASTAQVDVIEDLCARVPGLVQADCRGPNLVALSLENGRQGDPGMRPRGQLSWLTIWSLLRETNLLNERNFPNPTSLIAASETDRATAMTVDFLRGADRMNETSFGLLRSLSRPCGVAGQLASTDNAKKREIERQDAALDWMLAVTLADVQARDLTAGHPAIDPTKAPNLKNEDMGAAEELKAAINELSPLRLYEFSRSDLVDIHDRSRGFDTLRNSRRMEIPTPYRDEEILTALLISGQVYDTQENMTAAGYLDWRREVEAKQIGSYLRSEDGDLSGRCSVLTTKTEKPDEGNPGGPSLGPSNADDAFEIEEAQQLFDAFRQREEIALYVAGRIRTADSTRDERFWLTLVTGYEQYAMLSLFLFGLFVAVVRCAALIWAYLKEELWFVPADSHVPVLFSLRSSRWPLKLVATIMPAIGFIGTVRGIMLSLTGADQIVWASTINERSAAISALSTDLGLAFATTLIALLLGVVLSLVVAAEQRLGEVTVSRVENMRLARSTTEASGK
ncbi:MotA/TolQ/ExbB proton channel family protein [Phycobacter sp. K97]|uniref:MotA/TolQ/ExbB proton channel family protein n=1 Tax=Phycobacter sedimenti TaxID=3133977 RepID=UPI00311D9F6A